MALGRDDPRRRSPLGRRVLWFLLAGILVQRALALRVDWMRRGVSTLSTPLRVPLRFLGTQVGELRHRLTQNIELESRIQDLETALAQAQIEAQLGEELRLEMSRIQKALRFRDPAPQKGPVDLLLAPVRETSAHPHQRRLLLGRGSNHGIRTDLPVLSGPHVLGRILRVEAETSEVLLLQDPSSALGVRVQAGRLPGVAQGTGALELDLAHLPAGTRPPEGALVLTSSLSAYYPRGLSVGRVITADGGGLHVRPAVDPSRLEEVFVWMPSESLPGPPAAPTSNSSSLESASVATSMPTSS